MFRDLVGGQLSFMLVGSAPLSLENQKLIKSCLNIKILQVYGTTETCGTGCYMDAYDDYLGKVGPPNLGVQIKLIDWEEGGYKVTDKPYPRGELVIGNEAVSNGYYKLDEITKESFYTDRDSRRWFLTGDIGEVYPDGTFRIIDRKKYLVKLQTGEYVSLGKVW